ncbi:ATP-binding protein [Roseisolibacter agri]|uniref:histidine kinase n=1 Tax=Roseisolibacter agri TaxID=2014610 RepID=A0AA37V589_9BACT|nr:ATP-binding protein [Roseisolibacter agri]GLC23831.1 hybrid sensor histidine kinase/response regulator [Roseisolibacter agri]
MATFQAGDSETRRLDAAREPHAYTDPRTSSFTSELRAVTWDPGLGRLHDVDEAAPGALRDALESLVRLIERVAPGMRGSVLLLDDDGVTLHHGAAPNLPAAYCQAIDGAHIGPAAGSCGTAAYRRERVIAREIATDPLWADYRALAAPYGLAACWSTPIMESDGRVLGTFAMYYDEPRDPTPADIALTETATLLAKNIIVRARAAVALRARTETAERWARALRESEARFRQMAETIPVQVWTARPDGSFDFVTTRTAAAVGRPADALLGNGWLDVVHPEDVEGVVVRWTRSLQSGDPFEARFRLRGQDGAYRWHLVRAHAMCADDGRVLQWFGCNTDIEEYKRLEAALDAALADARQANQSKADFLAMMSHELRTPLNAIAGYAQLMLEDIPTPASEGQRDYLLRITRGQQHLLGLIEAVLTHAKLEAGKVTYRLGDVRAHDVLEAVDALTAPQRSARRIAYVCDEGEPELVFRADREKLVQILANVLSNAAKFTPEGGRITVTTAAPTPTTGAITIADTGIGMSPDQLQLVFEPYVQFDSALSRQHRGTGLGMPISRELARGMGGDLVAESAPGIGSTFTLVLPRA